jgi:hypothetical protein
MMTGVAPRLPVPPNFLVYLVFIASWRDFLAGGPDRTAAYFGEPLMHPPYG